MNNEIKTIIKKTAKIGGAVCITAGTVVLTTSKTALQAMLEGGKYLKDAVKKIVNEDPDSEAAEGTAEVSQEEPTAEPKAMAEEAPAEPEAVEEEAAAEPTVTAEAAEETTEAAESV